MELRYYLRILRRWWWLLVLGTLVPAGAAYGIAKHQPKTYQATATLLVNVTSNGTQPTYNDALLSASLVKTYSQMAAQPVVLEPVIQKLGLATTPARLSHSVSISPFRDTQLMNIVVQGSDPAQIGAIANAIAAVFIQQQDARLGAGQAANAISVAQPAAQPLLIGPRATLNGVVVGIVGLMFAVGLMFLLEYLDDTIKTPEDLKLKTDLSIIGTVRRFPREEVEGGPGLIMHPRQRHSGSAEAYRLLSASLEFVLLEQSQWTLLVASARPGEGKSTTVANLGLALARQNKRVIILDTDLRKPSQHHLFRLANSAGFTTLMLDRDTAPLTEQIAKYLRQAPAPNLKVLTSGPLPPNPAELISSSRFADILTALQQMADVVLMDSAPVSAVADTLFLAQKATATLLVVDAGHTRADAITSALEILRNSGSRVVGAVLNKVHGRGEGYYYYDRGYGYGYGGTDVTVSENSAERGDPAGVLRRATKKYRAHRK